MSPVIFPVRADLLDVSCAGVGLLSSCKPEKDFFVMGKRKCPLSIHTAAEGYSRVFDSQVFHVHISEKMELLLFFGVPPIRSER